MSYMASAMDSAMDGAQRDYEDWRDECHRLEAAGWTFVKIKVSNRHSKMVDIGRWLEQNCKGLYDHKLGAGEVIFERPQDATWFRLVHHA